MQKSEQSKLRFLSGLKDCEVFFSLLPDMVCIVTHDGIFKMLNPAWEKTLGYKVEELLGRPFVEFLHPDDVSSTIKEVEKQIAGEYTLDFINRYRCKDGTYKWLAWRASPGKDNLLYATARDITHLKTEGEIQRDSEEKYRRLVETTDTGYVIVDEKGLVVDANTEYVRLTGHTQIEDVVGHSVLEWTAPYDMARNAVEVQKCIQSGCVRNLGVDYISSDGKVTPVEINATVFKSLGTIRIMSLCRDVSARKRTETELLASQERYRTLSEAAFEGLVFCENGIFIDGNAQLAQILGYKMEELIGKPIMDYIFPDDRAMVQRNIDARSELSSTARQIRKDGSIITVETRARHFTYHGRDVRVTAMRDITERKKAEDALIEREIQLRTLSDNIPNGYTYQAKIYQDGRRYFTYLSAGVTRLHGISVDSVIEDPSVLYEKVLESSLIRLADAEDKSIRTMSVFSLEVQMQVTGGGARWFNVSSTPRKMTDGSTIWDGIVIDIDDLRRTEEEKLQLHEQLMQAQKMESVGRLAGGVAHDFNNMLTVIQGNAEFGMMHCDPTDSVYANLQAIEDTSLRAAALTRQLLTFARKQAVAPKALDLNSSVTDMMPMFKRLIGEDIEFAWHAGANLWSVNIDPSQFDQLLTNLCVNAKDAITGVGRITIETKNVYCDEDCCSANPGISRGEYVLLSVSDNGSGIDKDTLDHIFEPFFTTKGVGKGTGLGLSMVYGIVKQNNGFIKVDSEQTVGTTVKVFLPKHVGETAAASIMNDKTLPKGHGETVLLVEDDATVLKIGKALLQSLGYKVLAAGTHKEAVRLAKEYANEIRLLFTDVIMPEMNGRDLAKLILQDIPGLKCLFVSGYTADTIAHSGVPDEGLHFLQKPYSLQGLAVTVREILDQ